MMQFAVDPPATADMGRFGMAVLKRAPQEPPSATIDEIAARIAVIRELVAVDPGKLGELLDAAGAACASYLSASPHVPDMLALLDELETLVGVLVEQKMALALELQGYENRRAARQAYTSRPAQP